VEESGIFKRNLAVKLTAAEFAEKATELANVYEEIEDTERAAKAAAAGFKDEIGGLRTRAKTLRSIVKDKVIYRDVECKWVPDWASKSMILRRLDTQEAVDVRAMTAEELQGSFDLSPEDRRLPDTRETDQEDGEDDGEGDIETDGEPV